MDKIISTLTLDDLLIQLAEEAAELAQAATKYYRVTHGTNPSPVSLQDARDALVEEIAEVEDAKIERWRRRVCDAPRATDRD